MSVRIFLVLALSLLGFGLVKPGRRVGAEKEEVDAQQHFRQRLERLGKRAPDACEPLSEEATGLGRRDTESWLFSQGADIVATALNATDANKRTPEDRASDALGKLEKMSKEINADWPDESRFHFEVLDISPALVVKMTFRTSATYFVFGVPAEDVYGANARWQRVGFDTASLERDSARSLVDLFPLHRGPSGNARFLARMEPFGCAGSIGVIYEAREWDPQGLGNLQRIIGQEGAFGLDDRVQEFEQIGELKTDGPLITLPYCWFSGIDTWDNPSLCAVDTYDLSGDEVKFQSRIYNRPDLLPIAKVIEYARQHDYEAVRAYCASSQLARGLIQNFPAHFFAEDVRVTETGSGRESVEMGFDTSYLFELEELDGKWLVSAVTIEMKIEAGYLEPGNLGRGGRPL